MPSNMALIHQAHSMQLLAEGLMLTAGAHGLQSPVIEGCSSPFWPGGSSQKPFYLLCLSLSFSASLAGMKEGLDSSRSDLGTKCRCMRHALFLPVLHW